jgi:hypothetical protein
MQNTSLIYLILLLALLVAFPPAFAALLARVGGRRRRPDSRRVSVAAQNKSKVCANAN